MLRLCTSVFNVTGLLFLPYLYTFLYWIGTASKRQIDGFPKRVTQFSAIAKCAASRTDSLHSQMNSRFTGVDCPLLTDNATIRNVNLPTPKLTKPGSRLPLRKQEEIYLLSPLIELFSLANGAAWIHKAGF